MVGPFVSKNDINGNQEKLNKIAGIINGEVSSLESLGLTYFDLLLIVIISLSGVIAFFRGFVQEFLSLALWVFAFAAAMFLDEYLRSLYLSIYL